MDVILITVLVTLAIPLVVGVLTAGKFSKIAEMKGHKGYFKWCFFLGPVGWIMVASLPDRK